MHTGQSTGPSAAACRLRRQPRQKRRQRQQAALMCLLRKMSRQWGVACPGHRLHGKQFPPHHEIARNVFSALFCTAWPRCDRTSTGTVCCDLLEDVTHCRMVLAKERYDPIAVS